VHQLFERAAFAIPDLGTYHIQLDQPRPLHGAVAHVSHFISGCRVVREPVSGGCMRLVLRVMAASALMVMALCDSGLRNRPVLQTCSTILHLAAPDPIKAAEWYRKNLGGQPTTEGTDRLMFGETRVIFQRNEKATPSAGSVVDHIGFSSGMSMRR